MSKARQHIIATALDKRGRIVAVGVNNYNKSHPLQSKFASKAGHPKKIYLHAEIAAIIKARGARIQTLTVRRLSKSGEYLPSKPCAACLLALNAYGIKNIVYD